MVAKLTDSVSQLRGDKSQKPRATAKPGGPELEALPGCSGPGQRLWGGGDKGYIIRFADDTKVGCVWSGGCWCQLLAGWPLCDRGI